MSYVRSGGRGRLRKAGLVGLVAALSLCLTPGLADAAKKSKAPPRVATFNLYLGTDLPSLANKLNPAAPGNFASKPDSIANAIGYGQKDVQGNNFNTRAVHIAGLIKKNKVDLIGLQEAALWKVQIPTDGSPLNPAAERASTVTYDYVEKLLSELNKGAKTKKECGQAAKKKGKGASAAKKGKSKPCYRGYRLGISQNRFDSEFLGDFDNDPGPDGKTFDLADSATPGSCVGTPPGAPNGPACWLQGNDDTGLKLGEPTAAQCGDGIDNDGDGLTDYGPTVGVNETSGPTFNAGPGGGGSPAQGTAPPWGCDSYADNNEVANPPLADPNGLPPDTNFDHHIGSGNQTSADNGTPSCGAPGPTCPTTIMGPGRAWDGGGNGKDAAGISDCAPGLVNDTSPDAGPPQGAFPFAGYNGDQVPSTPGSQVPVCLFHGIDGDLSLTLRDAILVRVGDGVKATNPTGALFNNQVIANLPGGLKVSQNRGWVSVDASVRGKKFDLVNTHLEATDDGTVREDQATELINGPLATKPAVLVGDVNSDERSADPQSPPAMQRLLAAGFTDLVRLFSTSGHTTGSRAFLSPAETQGLITNGGDLAAESRIDRILTNGTFKAGASGPLDMFAGGLWTSDHAGVFASLGGKQKGKKKGGKKK